jgi:hypothetical protein
MRVRVRARVREKHIAKRHTALNHIAYRHVALSCTYRIHDKRESFGGLVQRFGCGEPG